MKNLIYLSILVLLISCSTETIQPQNSFAKQMGLQDIDTTSIWTYQTIVYFPNGDSTKYVQTHTVLDTATIMGKPAYKVEISTPFGRDRYKMRTDSIGVTIEKSGVINYYKYPAQDTFVLNNSCNIKTRIASTDTTLYIGDKIFANSVCYHTWAQPCSNSETYAYFQYGIGLVATHSQSGGNITKQYLLLHQ